MNKPIHPFQTILFHTFFCTLQNSYCLSQFILDWLKAQGIWTVVLNLGLAGKHRGLYCSPKPLYPFLHLLIALVGRWMDGWMHGWRERERQRGREGEYFICPWGKLFCHSSTRHIKSQGHTSDYNTHKVVSKMWNNKVIKNK